MLFKKIEEVKELIGIGTGNHLERLKPHISNAETAYIRPLLGANMFDELQEFYDEPPTGELTEVQEAMKELLGKVQKSLIHLAYWMGFQVLNATISDSGFKRSESDTVKSLYKAQETELKEYFRNAGFNAMDEVLEYLETNIEHFGEFKLTENWTKLKEAFIPDTKTFESVPYFINGSRLTFLRLKPHMQLVEDLQIKPLLGETIFAEIKAEMVKDNPAAKVVAILPVIRKPIAYLAAAMLMEESGADLTDKGLYFESTSAGASYNDTNRQPAAIEKIAYLAKRSRGIGESYLESLKSYLVAHAADWTAYSGQTGSVFRRDNTDKKTFWVG